MVHQCLRIRPWGSQNIVTSRLMAALNVFGQGDAGCLHCMLSFAFFVIRAYPVSSPGVMRFKNLPPSLRYHSEWRQMISKRLRLRSSVRDLALNSHKPCPIQESPRLTDIRSCCSVPYGCSSVFDNHGAALMLLVVSGLCEQALWTLGIGHTFQVTFQYFSPLIYNPLPTTIRWTPVNVKPFLTLRP
jgi:hypothetical protein